MRPEPLLPLGYGTRKKSWATRPRSRCAAHAPAVLGWDAWRAIDERYFIALLRAGVEAAIAEGVLPPRPPDALAHMLLGALTEAAMLMTRTHVRSKTRAEILETVDALLEGLRGAAHS